MLDAQLRPAKEVMFAPIADRLDSIRPSVVTASSVVLGLCAAVAAAAAVWWLAVILFLLGRLSDGLDGEMARARGITSDAGGYSDIVADTVVYAAVPIGAAIGSSIDHIWIVTTILLASFYVNTITWTYLTALFEKRRGQQSSTDGDGRIRTSVTMPAGLVEGFETMVFFVVILAVPGWMDWTMGIMAAAVLAGAVARFVSGRRQLDALENGEAAAESLLNPRGRA